jgi:hypothetical protein
LRRARSFFDVVTRSLVTIESQADGFANRPRFQERSAPLKFLLFFLLMIFPGTPLMMGTHGVLLGGVMFFLGVIGTIVSALTLLGEGVVSSLRDK